MRQRSLRLGAAVTGALAALATFVRPEVAIACAVCFGDEASDWPAAFLLGTALLLALPPAIVVFAGVAIYRATKRQEARLAAREQEATTSRPERHLRPV
jgi:hypothetical protein